MSKPDLVTSYNDAAAFLNGYWNNIIDDVQSGQKINRSAKDYAGLPQWQSITNFYSTSQKELSTLDVKQAGVSDIPADLIIRALDYFVDNT